MKLNIKYLLIKVLLYNITLKNIFKCMVIKYYFKLIINKFQVCIIKQKMINYNSII